MNSQVIKFVAGGGKTTRSEKILKKECNGLYLAFTNSVVKEINNLGYLSRTIDSLFQSFIIPKFTSIIPLIASGSKIKYIETDNLPSYQKGIANIKIDNEGNLYNVTKRLKININTKNSDLHNMTSNDSVGILKNIFSKKELRLTNSLRSDLSNYIIIYEAQDLKNYRENFAKLLYDSQIKLILLGDDNQNINGGGQWFESLQADEIKKESYRCPDNNCEWIRHKLNIEIYGNSNFSIFKHIDFNEILKYDDGVKSLLYNAKSGKNKEIIESWTGPKYTIKSAKGSTIYTDIVILGNTINKKNYYTAITRTTKNVYSTIIKCK